MRHRVLLMGVILLSVVACPAQSPFIRACIGSDVQRIRSILSGPEGKRVVAKEGAMGFGMAINGVKDPKRIERVKEILSLLVQKGVDPNAMPAGGALQVAAFRGQPEIIRHLLTLGAKPNVTRDLHALNALYVALTRRDVESARILIEAGADPNAPGYRLSPSYEVFSGYPLHVASYYGLDDIVRLLLAKGAKVNFANSYGQTALHIACLRPEGASAIPILLRAGADRGAKWNDETPLDVARRKGSTAAVRALGG